VRPPAQPLLRRGRSFPSSPDEDCGGKELLRRLPPPPANSLPRPSSPPSRACTAGHVLPSVLRAYRVHGAAGSWWMSTSASTNRVRSEATAGEVRAGRRESKEKQHRREEETVATWRRFRASPRFAGSSQDTGKWGIGYRTPLHTIQELAPAKITGPGRFPGDRCGQP
jgi:hypothetical protein